MKLLCSCPYVILMKLSWVLLCLQRAGRDSTNLASATRSVQSVRLTASHTMRGRCTASVRKTTFGQKETPPPCPVPVSVFTFLLVQILKQMETYKYIFGSGVLNTFAPQKSNTPIYLYCK